MKNKISGLMLFLVLIALLSMTGCGGGGGGGITGPITEVPVIPSDSSFEIPAGFSSEAFPKITPTVNLTLSSFKSGSEAYVFLMNYADSSQKATWSVTGPTFAANIRPRIAADSTASKPISPEHLFHLQLRQKARLMTPAVAAETPKARGSIRAAVGEGSTDVFSVHVGGSVAPVSIAATCKRSVPVSGTIKKVHFFVDNNDTDMANLVALLDKLSARWAAIYAKNREVFGEEPTGLLSNGIDATDFYVFLSRRVYTAGYFYTGDLNTIAQVPGSNQKKMFNLQLPSRISLGDSINNIEIVNRELSSTMAHEFQHMIHFWQRGNISDTWLEEAMSGYSEYVNGYQIENGFNQSKALQSNEYFSRVSQITFNKWHEDFDNDAVVNAYYGKAYLFGVWLAQHYGNNGSVIGLLTQRVNDVAAIEAFTGKSIEEVFARFMMALAVNDSTADRGYGIKGLNLNSNYSFAGLRDVKLTGPRMETIDAPDGGKDEVDLAPYSAAYIRIINGDDKDVNITATLSQYSALYQLRKD